jgi:hypothetical protein
MPALSPKHIALTLNAVVGRDCEKELLEAASKRILAMRDDPVRDYALSPQSIGMIMNACARYVFCFDVLSMQSVV